MTAYLVVFLYVLGVNGPQAAMPPVYHGFKTLEACYTEKRRVLKLHEGTKMQVMAQCHETDGEA